MNVNTTSEGLLTAYQQYINGEFVTSASSNAPINLLDLCTEENIATVPRGSQRDATYAVQHQWAQLPSVKRASYLKARPA